MKAIQLFLDETAQRYRDTVLSIYNKTKVDGRYVHGNNEYIFIGDTRRGRPMLDKRPVLNLLADGARKVSRVGKGGQETEIERLARYMGGTFLLDHESGLYRLDLETKKGERFRRGRKMEVSVGKAAGDQEPSISLGFLGYTAYPEEISMATYLHIWEARISVEGVPEEGTPLARLLDHINSELDENLSETDNDELKEYILRKWHNVLKSRLLHVLEQY